MTAIAPAEKRRATSSVTAKSLPAFRRALLRWYDENRRDLPWRKTRNPYRIWISEIMLQQTRVAAVLEHYRLFLQRFPDVRTLAAADESAVLAAWSGLGYYRRARMMRECAQEIVSDYGGHFPKTSEALQTLPGIGRYTAAAIASIAFAERIAVVDGNVERVLQRMGGQSLTAKEMWQRAQAQISPDRPADFNQAMMELGAMVCTPRQPQCAACPVRKWCATRGEFPRNSITKTTSKKNVWHVLDHDDARVRLVQRTAKASLMANMWELPTWVPISATQRSKSKSAAPESRASKGRKPRHDVWRTFRHSITETAYTVHVIRAAMPGTAGRWIPIEHIRDVPLTGLTRKILRAAGIL